MATKEGKEWDPVAGCWIVYDLEKERQQMLGSEAEEALKVHGEERRKRRKAWLEGGGTDEAEAAAAAAAAEVRDTALYDDLAVAPDASEGAIKKAYYRGALGCHPDRHPGDEAKKQEFQRISRAYEVLGDPERRKVYDETGKIMDGAEEGGRKKADPATFFAMIFGSEGFEDYVGELKLASMMGAASEDEGDEPDADEMEFLQRQRCVRLALGLVDLVQPHVSGDVDDADFFAAMRDKVQPLVKTPLGTTLVKVIGASYDAAASKALASWASGVYLSAKGSVHGAGTTLRVARGGLATVSKASAAAKADERSVKVQETEAKKRADASSFASSPSSSSSRVAVVQGDQQKAEAAPATTVDEGAAHYLIVSDNHSEWTAEYYASRANADAAWKKLSFKFASVLFWREGGAVPDETTTPVPPYCGWKPVKTYGTASAVEKIKAQLASNVGVVSTASIADAQAKQRQREVIGSVFETAWRISVLDIEATLKSATAKLFRDHSVPKEARVKRAKALKIVAKAFNDAAKQAGHKATWQEHLASELINPGQAPPHHQEAADPDNNNESFEDPANDLYDEATPDDAATPIPTPAPVKQPAPAQQGEGDLD